MFYGFLKVSSTKTDVAKQCDNYRGLGVRHPSSCILPPILSSMLILGAADTLVRLAEFPHCVRMYGFFFIMHNPSAMLCYYYFFSMQIFVFTHT